MSQSKINMKKYVVLGLIVFVAISLAGFFVLIAERNWRPKVFCVAFGKSISSLKHCVMNPFRDKEPENIAENILKELRNGKTTSVTPYLFERNGDNNNHILEKEKVFQAEGWRIGERIDTVNTSNLMYWIAHKDYPGEMEVHFDFILDSNQWKLIQFGAVY
ncbi:MAG TPA: hypothetical protein VK308_07940 [Pyrinomonadaceae bacterium]|nr:hypothetical protein [Pyrinomonadaceae bacterium]